MSTKNKPRRVAFVATVFRHLEAFHIPYMKLLQEQGIEVHAYGHTDHGLEGIKKNGIKCFDIPFVRNPFHPKNIQAYRMIKKMLRQEDYGMIHVHTPVASIVTRLAALQAKVNPIIYTAHGFHFHKGASLINWLIYYPIERIMARFTDFLITINKEDYNRAKFFAVRQKVLFIPGVGIDSTEYNIENSLVVRRNKRKELSIMESDFVILCVAELNKNKNQIQLIRAVQLLHNKYPHLKCVMVGTGKMESEYEAVIQEKGLTNVIKIIGFRRDVPELLAAADAVTLLSYREGLPKSLLEALSAGKPIVATNIRGNSDLVSDGINGFLVQINDDKGTAAAFEKLMSDEFLCRNMGVNGLNFSKEYDITNILPQVNEIYRSLYKLNKHPQELAHTTREIN
ncbi:glycosyltransferase family 4 protein [Paenibacillus chitinolyticus]|uniref:glycosyltransferase family 4 protein n=1 Tax=Paenibacillus chitinolyticus TaxID=79263 RepID=UPI00386BF732